MGVSDDVIDTPPQKQMKSVDEGGEAEAYPTTAILPRSNTTIGTVLAPNFHIFPYLTINICPPPILLQIYPFSPTPLWCSSTPGATSVKAPKQKSTSQPNGPSSSTTATGTTTTTKQKAKSPSSGKWQSLNLGSLFSTHVLRRLF